MGLGSRSRSKIDQMIEKQYKSINAYNEYIEEEIRGKEKEQKESILNDMSYATDVAINKHKYDKEYDLTKKIVVSIQGALALAAAYFGVNDEIKKIFTALGTEKYVAIMLFILVMILSISSYCLVRSFIKADYNGKIRDCEGFKYCVVQKLEKVKNDKAENISSDIHKEIDLVKTKDDEATKSYGTDKLESNDPDKDELKQSNDGFLKRTFKSIKNRLQRKETGMTLIYIDKVSYNKED